jgi:hypothetical protein
MFREILPVGKMSLRWSLTVLGWITEQNIFESSFEYLKSILKMAENYNIRVIGIVFPQSPNFKKTGSFGRYGIRRSEAPALLEKESKTWSLCIRILFFGMKIKWVTMTTMIRWRTTRII